MRKSGKYFGIFPDSASLANTLKEIPGIEKALKSPIIDVDQSKVVTVIERVILSLENEVPAECKDSLLVQIITGKYRTLNIKYYKIKYN